MLDRNAILKSTSMLLAGILAGGMLTLQLGAQSQSSAAPATTTPTPAPAQSPAPRPRPARLDKQAVVYYGAVWGIEQPSVKWVESGEIIRFTYHVLDPEKARILNDKQLEPSLVDYRAGVKLVIPSMENVGALRQTSTPEAGKSYWMAFSNSGRRVKRGDFVDVVIGNFQAQGLIVE
jgi:hypothetical protein